MIIPSIYLPITLDVFTIHFHRFFFNYVVERDYLKFTLYKIDLDKVGCRYNIELEEHVPSLPPIPNRMVNEIEAIVIDDNTIEVTGATLEEVFPVDREFSWAGAFINEFYKMIYKKWDIYPDFRYVNYKPFVDDVFFVTNAANAQLEGYLRHRYHLDLDKLEENLEEDTLSENYSSSDGQETGTVNEYWDKYNELMLQGLPPINPGFKTIITKIADQSKPIISPPMVDSVPRRGMSEWRIHRANLFKELKDKEPGLSRDAVAQKATDLVLEKIRFEILDKNPKLSGQNLDEKIRLQFREKYSHGKDQFDAEDVKNDYRAMEWKWVKATDTS